MKITFAILYFSEGFFSSKNDERIEVILLWGCCQSALQHLHLLVEGFTFGMKMSDKK